jgi:hypothetical protein
MCIYIVRTMEATSQAAGVPPWLLTIFKLARVAAIIFKTNKPAENRILVGPYK